MSTITETYQYGGGNEHEFVFSCRGRPFTALLSSFLPTPTSTLIDYELVKDLNLKMTDLQCRKFHYAGHKMRILGQVTTAVQTIKNGFTEGNFQISAISKLLSFLSDSVGTCVSQASSPRVSNTYFWQGSYWKIADLSSCLTLRDIAAQPP